MTVSAEESAEEPLDADKDDREEEEYVGEVLGELADGVLGAVVLHVPRLVPGVPPRPGQGQVTAALVLLMDQQLRKFCAKERSFLGDC